MPQPHDSSDAVTDPTAAADRPSKSQKKRDVAALQKLGESMLQLTPQQLALVPMPEALRDALTQARAITAHEARRRQLQYIGKLMRSVDPEPLHRALDLARGDSRAAVALMHRCERLRDALIADDAALTPLIEDDPQIDVQALRAMIRAARREQSAAAAPKHARLLYKWLHDRYGAAAVADITDTSASE